MTTAPDASSSLLTVSQVNKAGRVLRKHMQGASAEQVSGDDVQAALAVLLRFRAQHQLPLTKATMGLRSVVRTERCERVEVSQRLKRVPTILDKLAREPTLALANMQDIGGCRAVLSSIDEVRRVEVRLKKNRPPVGYSDYITQPRSSGYRGVHLVVVYATAGVGRRIEVQLRTQVMHDWAIAVEQLSGRLGQNLKADGRHAVQRLLAAVSEAMALEETGQPVRASLVEELKRLRLEAAPHLRGGPR